MEEPTGDNDSPQASTPSIAPAAGAWTLAHDRTVLVIDVVESVRLMAQDEAATLMQWQHIVRAARDHILPLYQGRLVKSLGDGLMAEFHCAPHALGAAFALHRKAQNLNVGRPAGTQLWLRAGLNTTDLYADDLDIYGQGVNLTARVTSLAEPGETVITASVRDGIIDGIDADIQDMGEAYLKHWPDPVRTWRAWPANTSVRPVPHTPAPDLQDLRPSIAVIPFVSASPAPQHQVVGELIADGVIAQLSRSGQLRVISRLSTSAMRGRQASLSELQLALRAGFVLSGSYSVVGNRLVISAELACAQRQEVVWADRMVADLADLLQPDSELIQRLTETCGQALLQATVQRASTQALPQLESSALLMGGIALMHRSTTRDLDRSRQLLEAVIERHKRASAPWAWLAKWHILNVVQGRSGDASAEFRRAIDIADLALDLEPDSSLALAIKGHAMCHLGSDLNASLKILSDAVLENPNDAICHLYRGFWFCMWGDAQEGIRETTAAIRLSPLDPMKAYFHMFATNCYLAAGDLDKALETSEYSLQLDRSHIPTLRAKMVAEYELGKVNDARRTFFEIKCLQPNFSLANYRSYSAGSDFKERVIRVLSAFGFS